LYGTYENDDYAGFGVRDPRKLLQEGFVILLFQGRLTG